MCINPLHGFTIGITDSGKRKLFVRGADVDYIYQDHTGQWCDGKYDDTFNSFNLNGLKVDKSYIEIPCGHCIECRLEYARNWANRMLIEAKNHKQNWFLTLTYDDEHLPPCNDGSPIHPLVKEHVQLFLKRLRKNSGQKIRFFNAGEYGDLSLRPHYHLILFGLELDPSDLSLRHQNFQGDCVYTSELISKCWKYGFHCIAPANWQTMNYVARYVVKKQKGDYASVYEDLNFPAEFTTMSRKPGIGGFYKPSLKDFIDNETGEINDEYYSLLTEYRCNIADINAYASITLSDTELNSDGTVSSKTFNVPKYFKDLYEIEYPVSASYRKETSRQIMYANEQLRKDRTHLSIEEYRKLRENSIYNRNKRKPFLNRDKFSESEV